MLYSVRITILLFVLSTAEKWANSQSDLETSYSFKNGFAGKQENLVYEKIQRVFLCKEK